jgi:hypothetical protein
MLTRMNYKKIDFIFFSSKMSGNSFIISGLVPKTIQIFIKLFYFLFKK